MQMREISDHRITDHWLSLISDHWLSLYKETAYQDFSHFCFNHWRGNINIFTCGEADRSSRGRFVFFLLLLTKFKKLRCLWTDLTDTLVHGQGRSCLPCHQVAPKSATRGRHQSATRNDRNIFYCLRVFLSVYKTQIFSNFENRMSQTWIIYN